MQKCLIQQLFATPPPKKIHLPGPGSAKQAHAANFRGGASSSKQSRGPTTPLVQLSRFTIKKAEKGAKSSQTIQDAYFSGTKFKRTGGGQRLRGRANDMGAEVLIFCKHIFASSHRSPGAHLMLREDGLVTGLEGPEVLELPPARGLPLCHTADRRAAIY